jgi:hypothetical protein
MVSKHMHNYQEINGVTVVIQTMLFIWKRRLLPLIITHWIADLSPGITALLFVH